jgi:predicted RNA-binding Zn-ribbon protein involved in translation (DUF1610 family)
MKIKDITETCPNCGEDTVEVTGIQFVTTSVLGGNYDNETVTGDFEGIYELDDSVTPFYIYCTNCDKIIYDNREKVAKYIKEYKIYLNN